MSGPRTADRAAVLAAAQHLDRVTAGRTAWLGVDGFGASGKTSLAAAIEAAVPRARVVHIDDFSGPHVREWDWPRFIRQVLRPLLAGRAARYQVRDWAADAGGEWVDLPPGHVVVVEGVSSTRREAAVPWDLTVWVDAPHDVRLARALARDGAALLPRWTADWMPSEQAYAAREHPHDRVDLLVDGTAPDA